ATWSTQIRTIVSDGKSVNVRLSRVIAHAKADLPYGDWTRFWQSPERPFAVRKAEKLAFVGENLTSQLPLDRAELCLPGALNTLYVLAHLPAKVALKLIDEGSFT